jgi:hypothetical protein
MLGFQVFEYVNQINLQNKSILDLSFKFTAQDEYSSGLYIIIFYSNSIITLLK